MFWYRAFVSLGRNSVVGTTIKTEEALPQHLTVDEKHHRHNAQKAYIATTAAKGCLLGAALCESPGKEALTEGYEEFADELGELDADFQPKTVNCDGWSATQEAMRTLFPGITVILCFLHSCILGRDQTESFTQAHIPSVTPLPPGSCEPG